MFSYKILLLSWVFLEVKHFFACSPLTEYKQHRYPSEQSYSIAHLSTFIAASENDQVKEKETNGNEENKSRSVKFKKLERCLVRNETCGDSTSTPTEEEICKEHQNDLTDGNFRIDGVTTEIYDSDEVTYETNTVTVEYEEVYTTCYATTECITTVIDNSTINKLFSDRINTSASENLLNHTITALEDLGTTKTTFEVSTVHNPFNNWINLDHTSSFEDITTTEIEIVTICEETTSYTSPDNEIRDTTTYHKEYSLIENIVEASSEEAEENSANTVFTGGSNNVGTSKTEFDTTIDKTTTNNPFINWINFDHITCFETSTTTETEIVTICEETSCYTLPDDEIIDTTTYHKEYSLPENLVEALSEEVGENSANTGFTSGSCNLGTSDSETEFETTIDRTMNNNPFNDWITFDHTTRFETSTTTEADIVTISEETTSYTLPDNEIIDTTTYQKKYSSPENIIEALSEEAEDNSTNTRLTSVSNNSDKPEVGQDILCDDIPCDITIEGLPTLAMISSEDLGVTTSNYDVTTVENPFNYWINFDHTTCFETSTTTEAEIITICEEITSYTLPDDEIIDTTTYHKEYSSPENLVESLSEEVGENSTNTKFTSVLNNSDKPEIDQDILCDDIPCDITIESLPAHAMITSENLGVTTSNYYVTTVENPFNNWINFDLTACFGTTTTTYSEDITVDDETTCHNVQDIEITETTCHNIFEISCEETVDNSAYTDINHNTTKAPPPVALCNTINNNSMMETTAILKKCPSTKQTIKVEEPIHFPSRKHTDPYSYPNYQRVLYDLIKQLAGSYKIQQFELTSGSHSMEQKILEQLTEELVNEKKEF